jgi:hypothetical protein
MLLNRESLKASLLWNLIPTVIGRFSSYQCRHGVASPNRNAADYGFDLAGEIYLDLSSHTLGLVSSIALMVKPATSDCYYFKPAHCFKSTCTRGLS